MKTYTRIFLFFTFLVSSTFFFQEQNVEYDQIVKHDGEVILGKILKIDEYGIIFKYVNEDAEHLMGKYAIDHIVYGTSGRVQKITEKITINSTKEWAKVVLIYDKREVSGLQPMKDIRGKTNFVNFHTANTADLKAEKKMKIEAVENNCIFVLLITDKETNYSGGSAIGKDLGNLQTIKKGLCYTY